MIIDYKTLPSVNEQLKNYTPEELEAIKNFDINQLSYLRVKKILSIFVTLQCNLRCSYCFIQDKRKTKLDLSKIPKNISGYEYDTVSIVGGEPGILSYDEIGLLFDALTNVPIDKLLIVTNGLFIDKYYNYFPYLDYSYHITDFSTPKEIKLYPSYSNVSNLIVVTSKELENIITSVEYYTNTQFQIVENKNERLITNKRFHYLCSLPNVTVNKIKDSKKKQSFDCYNSIHAYS